MSEYDKGYWKAIEDCEIALKSSQVTKFAGERIIHLIEPGRFIEELRKLKPS